MSETVEAQVPEETAMQPEPQAEQPPAETPMEQPTAEMTEAFLMLQQQVPTLRGVEEVPQEVFQTAEKENISLFDAYLRYRFYEQQAIAAEQARRERAAACSAGSLQTGALRAAPVSDAFARAFEKALS